MRPVVLAGDPTETVVRFSLQSTTNGVSLIASDESGQSWVVAIILPGGIILQKGIPKSSGIPIDASGHIQSQKE